MKKKRKSSKFKPEHCVKSFEGEVEYGNAEYRPYSRWVTIGNFKLVDMLEKMTYHHMGIYEGKRCRIRVTIEILDPGEPYEFNKDYVEGRLIV